ncbi:MAG: SWIM zinc finger family protein [Desulfobacterales bacterium]|nr:SWIM zinc finger family protein [Desulfobacterales bacterium]
MVFRKKQPDKWTVLSWDDLNDWAGERIVGRGRNYQRQGRVSDLSLEQDGGLLAWVDGSRRYATHVVLNPGGLPTSHCTCPYEFDCKHAVAAVLEYLKRVENGQRVSKAAADDDRLTLLADEEADDELLDDSDGLAEDRLQQIETFLKGKTKAQLVELLRDIADQHPEVAQDLRDRQHLDSGNVPKLMASLRREIRDTAEEPGWQNYWDGEGYTPDYSGVRKKIDILLKAGHADEVLELGRELLISGTCQVEESHDEGETAMEIAVCMPLIARGLDRSSLPAADKLVWALDAVLDDPYDLYDVFVEYLLREHPESAWHEVADQLLSRLEKNKRAKGGDSYDFRYERDRLSDWAVHALAHSGRDEEIIPLCEREARKTGSYVRLVDWLISAKRYEEAESWIHKGIRATESKWPGIASMLRKRFLEIHTRRKKWPVVAAIQAEDFVRAPSQQAFLDCKKAADKIKAWPEVRGYLLGYLETGNQPWNRKGWPLPESGLDRPQPDRRRSFPMVEKRVAIAILEKKPDEVLKWYDQRTEDRFGWYDVSADDVAAAVQSYAPDRAAAIWKAMAERLIAEVKPKAYQKAATYLRKAARVMHEQKKAVEWERYLDALRQEHFRKRRLLEILDGLEAKPIVKKHR